MRAIWKGSISFGLVNVPVSLFTATRPEELKFHLLRASDLSPINYRRVAELDGKEVPWEQIVKGYEYEKGRYVVLKDEDFKRVDVEATQTIDIVDFVDAAEINPIFFQKPYYLEPQKGGDRVYHLLREALQTSGRTGIAKVVIKTRQHLAAIKPNGDLLALELMHFASEIVDPSDLRVPAAGKTARREQEMAQNLIDQMTVKWDPARYTDDYRSALLELIERKVEQGGRAAPTAARPSRGQGKVIDLMAALKQSLDEAAQTRRTKSRPATKPSEPPQSGVMPVRYVAPPQSQRPTRRSLRPSAHHSAPRAGEFVEPMKALAVSRPPEGDWLSEIKFDGYRALAVVQRGRVALWSRNRHIITADYPAVAAALGRLKCDEAVLDGEIVAVDAAGRPRFQLLQQRGDGGATIFYYLFDLLELDGRSLVAAPIEERKAMLERLLAGAADPLRLSTVFPVAPAELLEEVRRQGLEGVVMKAAGSRYEPGRRGGAWLKCRLAREQEFVIGGCTPPAGARVGFGALLVGYYQGGKLLYAGKVGTGFTTRALRELGALFRPLRRGTSPFANLPLADRPRWGTGMSAAEMSGVTWLRPTLVAQIRFAEWTEDGLLRQPVFLGLRDDKPAHAIRREALAS